MEPVAARLTPYERILEPLEEREFPAIRDEAASRGTDLRRRDQFQMLASVGATMQELITDDAPAEATDEYAELLFHAFQFWMFGRRLYAFDREVTESLLAPNVDLGIWILAAPPSCYLQLPNQLVWARLAADAPYEPVDGCFVFVDETQPAPDAGAHLRIQLLLGVRPDRPGVSLVSYRTDLDPRTATQHATDPWRADGTPFANTIPGGERKGFYSISTTSELEAFVLRALWYLDTHSRALIATPGGSPPDESRLPHTLVRLER
ncbi:MAG: hypothetical protein M3081_20850 [Gemmatimonadota bacterium]|nr:hypothetical protein [Gemmatimonadota bacterium]